MRLESRITILREAIAGLKAGFEALGMRNMAAVCQETLDADTRYAEPQEVPAPSPREPDFLLDSEMEDRLSGGGGGEVD